MGNSGGVGSPVGPCGPSVNHLQRAPRHRDPRGSSVQLVDLLRSCELVAFVSVTDSARARAFYEATLGLPLVEESPFALVFDAHGTSLRVTPVADLRPLGSTVLGWAVPDIVEAVNTLTERGIVFEHYEGLDQDASGIWHSPGGAAVAWFRDPDGNILSLTQFLAA